MGQSQMNICRYVLISFLFVISEPSFAARVNTEEDAIKLTLQAIHKYQLTTLKDECFSTQVDDMKFYFDITVREVHNPACGGAPEVEPRMFNVRVRKRDGRLSSDAYDAVTYQRIDHKRTY